MFWLFSVKWCLKFGRLVGDTEVLVSMRHQVTHPTEEAVPIT